MPPISILMVGQRMFHINILDFFFTFSVMFDRNYESMIGTKGMLIDISIL